MVQLARRSAGSVRVPRQRLAHDLHVQGRAARALVARRNRAGQSRRDTGGVPPVGGSKRNVGVRRIGDDDGRGDRTAAGGDRAGTVAGAWGAAADGSDCACYCSGDCCVRISEIGFITLELILM